LGEKGKRTLALSP